ncbi:VOC family protein [Nonomuraea longicatena]|uniref:VOC domain-containing protein n=1 Tax=Nonomuraea longicatena TaxID=83682 RepID=A0ABP4ACK6_9ACTN
MHGTLHHVELWVDSLEAALPSFAWLFGRLGYTGFQSWEGGRSWLLGQTYVVIEQSPERVPGPHERRRSGLNHLAFHVDDVDALTKEAQEHGWRLLFADRHPHAGGPAHYAAYLENDAGFEVELVRSAPAAG